MWPVRLVIFALGITFCAGLNPDPEDIEAARDDKVDALTVALLNPLPALQNYPNVREARGTGFGNFASLFGGGGGGNGGSMFGGSGSMLSNMFSGFTNVVDRVAQAMGGPAMPKNIKQAISDGPRSPMGGAAGMQAPRMTRPGPDVFKRIEQRKRKLKGHARRKRQTVSVKALRAFNNLGKDTVTSVKNTPFTDDLTAILLGITEFFSGLKNLGKIPVSRINEKSAQFQNGAQKLVARAENLPNSLFGSMRSKRETKNDTKTAPPKIEYVPVPSAMVNGKIVPVALPEELANVITQPHVENIPIPSAVVNGKIVPVALPEELMQPKVETVPVPSAMVNGKIVPVAIPEELAQPKIETVPVPSAVVNGKVVPVALPEELTKSEVETIPVPSAIVNGKIVPVAIPEDSYKPEVETIPVPSALVNGKVVPVAIPEELAKQNTETIPVPSAVVKGRIVPVAIPEELAKDMETVPVPSVVVNGKIVPVAIPEELTRGDGEAIPVPSAIVNGKVVPVALPEELAKPDVDAIPIPSAMINGRIVPVAIPEDMAQPSENIPIPSAMINGNIVPVAIPEDMARSPVMPASVHPAMLNGILPVGLPGGFPPPVRNIPIPSAMVNGRLVPVAVPAEDSDDYDEYQEVPSGPPAMFNGLALPVGHPPIGMPPPSGFPFPMGMTGRFPSDEDNDVKKEIVNRSLRELAVAHQENWFTYLRSLNGSTTECHEWDFCKTARASNLFETSVARNGAKLLSYVVAYLRDRRDKVGHRLAQAVDCCLSDNLLMGERCESYYHEKCLKTDPKHAKATSV